MTSVDFYILGATKQLDRLDFVCRLVEKVYGEGRKVYLHTENEKQAIWLDSHLWKFKPDSFIPHNIIGNSDQPEAQVQIGWQDHPAHHNDVLVNLSGPIPTFFSRFDRVLEVVIQDEAVLEQTRKHYKFYKDRGYEVTHRDLRG
jgi:DNA polymerase-3 subunit chi